LVKQYRTLLIHNIDYVAGMHCVLKRDKSKQMCRLTISNNARTYITLYTRANSCYNLRLVKNMYQ